MTRVRVPTIIIACGFEAPTIPKISQGIFLKNNDSGSIPGKRKFSLKN
jgi:hypothetical protein